MKESFIKATLGGSSRSDIDAWTAHFVPRLLANGTFADAREKIAEHRRRGDHLVLMSASTDLYVPTIARELGFNENICTGVRWDGDSLNGSLTTPNRKGEEKARCFLPCASSIQASKRVAYGNSSPIFPTYVWRPRFLVNGTPRRAAGREPGRELRRMALIDAVCGGSPGPLNATQRLHLERRPRYYATRRLHMTHDSTDRIEKQILIKAPRKRVWRALTEASEFGDWFRVKLTRSSPLVRISPGRSFTQDMSTSPGR